nr:PREDICTED: uncharacterized protein LOC107398503 [Tribolium castaneum]|eukprot:XP_015838253.1 PREDICTED: uncharacterized protein LOC107398503 [Tribolium castaneum]
MSESTRRRLSFAFGVNRRESVSVSRFIKVGPQQGSHLSLSIAHYKATNHIALFHSPYLFMLHKNYPPSAAGAGVLISAEQTKKFQIQSNTGDQKCSSVFKNRVCGS